MGKNKEAFNNISDDNIFEEFSRLKEIENIFLSFLETTPDFVYIKDNNHKFLFASDSFAKLTGHKSWSELVGRTDFDIFPKEHAEVYYKEEEQLINSGKNITGLEEPYYDQNGKLCYVVSSKRAMYDDENNIVGLFGISRDITKRKELELKLKDYANYDSLTKLHNRRFFLEQSKQLLRVCKREHRSAVVYFIDLDNFKQTNDKYGHEAGDKVLSEVAKRLNKKFRASDLVCRFGGDEFLVFTIMQIDEKSINKICNDIKELISKTISFENEKIKVSCSVGISFYPDEGISIEKLIKKSDKKMYEDKKGS